MRVLSVNVFLDPVLGGGTVERTVQLARALPRAGLDVTVLATDAGLGAGTPPPDVGASRLELVPSMLDRFYIPRVSAGEIDRFVGGADVVHISNHWTILNLLVHRSAVRQGIPYVICPAGALPLFGRSQWLKRAYNAAGGRRIITRASAWVAVTQLETQDFRAYGVEPSAVDVIPNGIEPADFIEGDAGAFRAGFGLEDRKVILFVGRLNPIKGPDLLLEAFAAAAEAFPAHTLVYAGPDGGSRAALEQRARTLGISDRVVFTGWLGGADKAGAYRAADLVVIPSRQEAMSLIALEAGVCGTPVLMTDRCGFDVATEAGAAVAVPADSARIAEALRELLPGGRLAGLGARLRELVRREYTWDVAAARYAALFARVAGRAETVTRP